MDLVARSVKADLTALKDRLVRTGQGVRVVRELRWKKDLVAQEHRIDPLRPLIR